MSIANKPAAIREKCGSTAGWNQHQRNSEEQCPECRGAWNTYIQARRATPEGRAEARRSSAAQSRARQDLVRLHRAEYDRLFAAHLDELEADARRETYAEQVSA